MNTGDLPWDDCAIKRGHPFPFRSTEGFVTPERLLWKGAVADLLLVIGVSIALYFVWYLFARKSRPVL
jgi:hypothetical protein